MQSPADQVEKEGAAGKTRPTRHGHADLGRSAFRVYLAFAVAIALLLSLDYAIKHRVFAFADIGIDLFSFYYPLQIAFARQLRHLHQVTWSFELGLGGYLGLPLKPGYLLTAWMPDAWQLHARLAIYWLKIIAAGSFAFGYLRRIGFAGQLAVLGALAFTFSGYSIINGQWDSEGLVIVQFAAYLFFFESYLHTRNFWYAVAAGLTAGAASIFTTYTLVLLTGLYLIVRPWFAPAAGLRTWALSFLRFCAWATVGFSLTAVLQIPNLYYFFDSPRVSGNHAIFSSMLGRILKLNNEHLVFVQVASLFGKDIFGTASKYHGWSNWFEAPGFYVGILMLVCLPQLLGPFATRREKRLCAAGCVLLVLYMLWPALRLVVYGFGHDGFRLSTLWVSSGILVLGLAALRRICLSGIWRAGLAATVLAIIVMVLAVAYHASSAISVRQVVLVISFAALYCLLLWRPAGVGAVSFLRVLIPVFALELLLFSMPALMDRNAVKANGTSTHGSYEDGTTAALARLRSLDGTSEFYRVEKTYRSVFLDDALVQNYSGTKSYFFHGKSITRFVDKMHLPRPHRRTNYIASMIHRPDVLNLLAVRYILSRDRKPGRLPQRRYVGSAGGINIYRNTAAFTFGHLYRDVADEADAEKMTVSQRDTFLLDHVILDDPSKTRAALASLNRPGRGTADTGGRVSMRKMSDIHLEGNVLAPAASVLLIPMPFDIGWSARIDGRATRLFRADYGLTALLLAPGEHSVSLHYKVPGRKPGQGLSAAALIILVGSGVTKCFKRRRARSG